LAARAPSATSPERLDAVRPSAAAQVEVVAGHPALVHPAGLIFAVDLGACVAVLDLGGLVVAWRELPADASRDELARAVRAAFRQASRMAR
jgi:hypothetical protein